MIGRWPSWLAHNASRLPPPAAWDYDVADLMPGVCEHTAFSFAIGRHNQWNNWLGTMQTLEQARAASDLAFSGKSVVGHDPRIISICSRLAAAQKQVAELEKTYRDRVASLTNAFTSLEDRYAVELKRRDKVLSAARAIVEQKQAAVKELRELCTD